MGLSTDIAIVGGGAAGLMLASALKGYSFLLLEAGNRCGRKVTASGGGFANVTHGVLDLDRYDADRDFIEPALASFDNEALMGWCRAHKIELEHRDGGEIFTRYGAEKLTSALERALDARSIQTHSLVQDIERTEEGFVLSVPQGNICAKRVVLATGSSAWPSLGALPDGLALSQKLGLKTAPFAPALCGLTLQPPEFWMKTLSGISQEVAIHVADRALRGNLLFAHRGISGPAVLNASLWWKKGSVAINFLPKYPIERVLSYRGKKSLASLLPLPRRLLLALLQALEIPSQPPADLNDAQRQSLHRIWRYEFSPAGTFGLAKAEACRGGVVTDQIDPQTMQVRSVPGLYVVGELLNVTGEVGGFNLQWAFSSAQAVARALFR